MRLTELAEATGARLEGVEAEVSGAAGLDEATAGQVTFLSNPRYTPRVQTTRASAIFVAEGVEVGRDIAILRATDPYLAYTRALRLFHPEPAFEGFVHPSAVIDSSAQVGEGVWIGAHAVVGRNVRIGSSVRIYPNATIYDGVQIGAHSVIHSNVSIREGSQLGERVVVHNNSVIGSDGFGYARDEEKRWLKIPTGGRRCHRG